MRRVAAGEGVPLILGYQKSVVALTDCYAEKWVLATDFVDSRVSGPDSVSVSDSTARSLIAEVASEAAPLGG